METLLEKNLQRHYQIIKFLIYRDWEKISTIRNLPKSLKVQFVKALGISTDTSAQQNWKVVSN